MKKSLIFTYALPIILFLIMMPFATSISTNLKSDYSQKDTMIIKLTGNFLEPLKKEDIEFKRNNVLLALEYGLELLDKDYYIWAISPNDAGNYTLWIKNVITTVDGVQTKLDFSQNFTVGVNSTNVGYNIRPAAISTGTNFSIDVISFQDSPQEISLSFQGSSTTLLKPGRNTINFNVDRIYGTRLYNIQIGAYSIPAYIRGPSSIYTQYINYSSKAVFVPEFISRNLRAGSEFQQNVTLRNVGDSPLKKITFSFDTNVFEVTPESTDLNPQDNISIQIKLINPLDKNLFSIISAKNAEFSNGLPISLSLLKVTPPQNNGSLPLNCNEVGGIICPSGQVCSSTNTAESQEGICCLGLCKSSGSGGGGTSSSTWPIIIIVFLLLVIGGYLFYRYKKAPKSSGTVQEKVDSFELKKPDFKTKLP